MGDLYHEKRNLRGAMEKLRCEASIKSGAQAAQKICQNFLASVEIKPNAIIAAYISQRCEIDPAPLTMALWERNCRVALPVVTGKHCPLTFRAYAPDAKLCPGYANIPEPSPQADALSPDIFLVPLLAFDRRGCRLGYGGGFYDRTLSLARLCKNVLAIGVAFACQEIEMAPNGAHDARLDAVITENGFLQFER